MKGTNLGEFEELILLSVAVLDGEAYGISIAELIMDNSTRKVTISTVHNALYRLEEKGMVSSTLGGATSERGGRRKRLFVITSTGQQALEESRDLRNRLYHLIPG